MSTISKSTKSKTDNSSEKYLDNLLNSIYGTEDGKGGSLVDQSAFLEQFENELENETYDEYLSEFEKELGDDDAKAAGRAMDIQTPAPDDKDESLDEVLSDFDRKMKEQEEIPDDSGTSAGEQSVNIEKKNLEQAVENFEPVIEENNEADIENCILCYVYVYVFLYVGMHMCICMCVYLRFIGLLGSDLIIFKSILEYI